MRWYSRIVDSQPPWAAAGVPAEVFVVGALQHLALRWLVAPRRGVQLQEVRHETRVVQLELVLDGLRGMRQPAVS